MAFAFMVNYSLCNGNHLDLERRIFISGFPCFMDYSKMGGASRILFWQNASKEEQFMSIEMNTAFGQIDISNEVVATIAGGAAVDCFGIVGMASKNQIKDGITEILRKENFSRGVIVRQQDEKVEIDMYIMVSYGTKISEIAHNVQQKVKYTLNQMVGLSVDAINIYVQGVRVTNP
jgi:uncharacterized alkaline shock family protein YloU